MSKGVLDEEINKDLLIEAKELVENKIKELREKTPNVKYIHDKLAEIEINKFYFEGKTVDRIMIVLRVNGCEHYKKNGGCSMRSHFNGTDRESIITTEEYIRQWESVIDGSALVQYRKMP